MARSSQFTIYPDADGVVLRWKHNGKRIVVKMKGVSEADAQAAAIPLLVEALASLRSSEAGKLTTVA